MGRAQQNKGRPPRTVLSVNGRMGWRRVRSCAPGEGSDRPIDPLMDLMESAISVGMRERCCRMGIAGRSFARSTENLYEAAQIRISERMLRNVVESKSQAVSRKYASADRVLVPTTTEAEKQKRRATVLGKRETMSRKQRRRLGPVKKGSDQRYKQVYVTMFYDQAQAHRLVGVTRKNHRGLGKLLGRDVARLGRCVCGTIWKFCRWKGCCWTSFT